jgi:hypothetical protein
VTSRNLSIAKVCLQSQTLLAYVKLTGYRQFSPSNVAR